MRLVYGLTSNGTTAARKGRHFLLVPYSYPSGLGIRNLQSIKYVWSDQLWTILVGRLAKSYMRCEKQIQDL